MPWVVTEHGKDSEIHSCTFKIHGLTESKLDDLVKPLDLGAHARLSFRAHYPDLTLRLTVSGGKNRNKTFVDLCEQIRRILGSHIYAEGDLTLEESRRPTAPGEKPDTGFGRVVHRRFDQPSHYPDRRQLGLLLRRRGNLFQ